MDFNCKTHMNAERLNLKQASVFLSSFSAAMRNVRVGIELHLFLDTLKTLGTAIIMFM